MDRVARRAAIVSAATAAFAERGIANTAVSDIVKAAGVAQGTFYLYFKSKDDVVVAAAERIGDIMVDGIERVVAMPERSAVDRFLALLDQLSSSTSDPDASELIEIVHREGNRALHDRLVEQLTPRFVSLIERVIDQGLAEGVFAVPDARVAAWFVLGGLHSAELSGVPLTEMPAALAAATTLALRTLGYAGDPRER
ncbi:MAG: TetR/AcrR family transcriptional regulator [Cellulomonas sp.]